MKILFAGEGGQGVQLAAEVLAKSAFKEGKPCLLIPNFGVEQRGGISVAFVVIGKSAYPKFDQADILAIFCDRAVERVKKHVGPKTKIIYSPLVTLDIGLGEKVAVEKNELSVKVWNMFVLSKIVDITGIVKKETIKEVLEERLKDIFIKDPGLRVLNMEALE